MNASHPPVPTIGADAADPADEDSCVRLAASPETSPDTLRALARDGRVTVRAAVALNPSTPDGVDAALAGDADTRVRQLLGHKLALLIPGLSDGGQLRLRRQAMATLRRLVDDEAERVRHAIADLVKDMPQAPRELILRLARDTSVPVSQPVLLLSPVLTPADLLALLASPPSRATAATIAARQGLTPDVASAIAEGADSDAIRVLLCNRSAQLQEAALDALAARAAGQESWHEPMVRRPRLSARAATTLSDIVTTHLLAVLAERPDLPPDAAALLRRRLSERRLAEPPSVPPTPRGDTPAEEAMSQARALRAAGRLDEGSIRAAALRGDARMCGAMLAVSTEVALSVVDRAASLRSAKGVLSLVWLAGLSMDLAVTLQILVGRVAPGAVLRSLDGADFPLTVEEMRWQIELLKQMGR